MIPLRHNSTLCVPSTIDTSCTSLPSVTVATLRFKELLASRVQSDEQYSIILQRKQKTLMFSYKNSYQSDSSGKSRDTPGTSDLDTSISLRHEQTFPSTRAPYRHQLQSVNLPLHQYPESTTYPNNQKAYWIIASTQQPYQ